MRTPEEITEEIMSTMDYYVSRWMDREGAKKDLIDTIREELKPELPDDCIMGQTEVKYCSIRNGDGWRCKHCA